MIVLICSGGPSVELCLLERFLNREDCVIIGADRGAYTLLQQGITPNLIVGDFDSVNELEWAELESKVQHIVKVRSEKEETDTDLALRYALLYSPTEIILTGVTGGRLDHEEAAKRALLRVQVANPTIRCSIENKQNTVTYLVEPGKKIPLHRKMRYVSFFAVQEPIEAVTLRGVKYETMAESMDIYSSRFTSNEVLDDDAYISFSNGICLMITSID